MTGVRAGQAVEGDILTFFCSVPFSGDFRPRQVWSDADGRPLDGSREETAPANGPTTGVSRSNVRLAANRTMHGRRLTCTTHVEYRNEVTGRRVRCRLFRVSPPSPVPPSKWSEHYISMRQSLHQQRYMIVKHGRIGNRCISQTMPPLHIRHLMESQ